MGRQTFDTAVYENWAQRYDCTVEHLNRPGTEILPDDDFANSSAIHIWTIGKRAFARTDPACEEIARLALAAQPAGTTLSAEHLGVEITAHPIRKVERDLYFYLYPPDFHPVSTGEEFVIRQLTSGDADALAALQAACSPDETEMAEVSVEDEIGFGCFAGTQMVALATGFRLTGFMDIGVLTHPNYRRRQLGKACVSALCRWCIENDVIAQYRCNTDNTGSRSIAERLAFSLFFTLQSVYFTPNGTKNEAAT